MIPYIVGDLEPFNDILNTIENAEDILASVVEGAIAEVSQSYLAELAEYPRPSVHPFRWSYDDAANERARRWYFAAIRRGEIPTDGTRYKRSGRFGKSWDSVVQETGDSVDAVLGTKFDKASYVVGNADGTLNQIPGHKRTGWYEFQPIGERWADDVVRVVRREFPGEIERRLD